MRTRLDGLDRMRSADWAKLNARTDEAREQIEHDRRELSRGSEDHQARVDDAAKACAASSESDRRLDARDKVAADLSARGTLSYSEAQRKVAESMARSDARRR